jgi:hypothetical protein
LNKSNFLICRARAKNGRHNGTHNLLPRRELCRIFLPQRLILFLQNKKGKEKSLGPLGPQGIPRSQILCTFVSHREK